VIANPGLMVSGETGKRKRVEALALDIGKEVGEWAAGPQSVEDVIRGLEPEPVQSEQLELTPVLEEFPPELVYPVPPPPPVGMLTVTETGAELVALPRRRPPSRYRCACRC